MGGNARFSHGADASGWSKVVPIRAQAHRRTGTCCIGCGIKRGPNSAVWARRTRTPRAESDGLRPQLGDGDPAGPTRQDSVPSGSVMTATVPSSYTWDIAGECASCEFCTFGRGTGETSVTEFFQRWQWRRAGPWPLSVCGPTGLGCPRRIRLSYGAWSEASAQRRRSARPVPRARDV
jgi:hypothetical protein